MTGKCTLNSWRPRRECNLALGKGTYLFPCSLQPGPTTTVAGVSSWHIEVETAASIIANASASGSRSKRSSCCCSCCGCCKGCCAAPGSATAMGAVLGAGDGSPTVGSPAVAFGCCCCCCSCCCCANCSSHNVFKSSTARSGACTGRPDADSGVKRTCSKGGAQVTHQHSCHTRYSSRCDCPIDGSAGEKVDDTLKRGRGGRGRG